MATNIIYFNLFSIIAVFFSVVLICFKNPVFSIFSLIVTLISSIFLLLIIEVEFLAYIYLIVYVGAIAVLFLFVIMLLNIRGEENKVLRWTTWSDPGLNILLGLKLFFITKTLASSSWFINSNFSYSSSIVFKSNDLLIFGAYLYTDFFFNFLLVGIVLLISMVGTLVLATNK